MLETGENMVVCGDLIRFNGSGKYATVIRESYTKRFMEQEDYEMVTHGMGHLAGIWAGAIDIIYTETGRKQTIRVGGPHTFEVIKDEI